MGSWEALAFIVSLSLFCIKTVSRCFVLTVAITGTILLQHHRRGWPTLIDKVKYLLDSERRLFSKDSG